MGNMRCSSSVRQPVIRLTIVIFGITKNILVAIVAIIIIVCSHISSIVGIKGYQLPMKSALLGIIISILSIVLLSLVGGRSLVLTLALIALHLGVLVSLPALICVMAISTALAALVFSDVATLVSIVAYLPAVPALALGAQDFLQVRRGVRHTTGKGRMCILSFQRKCDLFMLLGLLQLILLGYDANELLAIDAPLQINIGFIFVLVLSHIGASELIPGPRKRCSDLLLEEVIVVNLPQLAREQDLLPLVLELG